MPVPQEYISPPAMVQPAEQMTRVQINRTPGEPSPLQNFSFDPQLRTVIPAPEAAKFEDLSGISNRVSGGCYRLIYVNGIRTSQEQALQSTLMARRAMGITDCEVTLLYNPIENAGSSGVKILGGVVSSRLGRRAEPECVTQMREHIRTAIETPGDRLILVSHSHGSLITKNALDRLYDEYAKTPAGEKKWLQESRRIEVIMYAPLVRSVAPGPEAISLLNSLDLPSRGIGGVERVVAGAKHYTGWREQQSVRTIIYSPERNKLGDIVVNPCLVHDSIDLILDNVGFNFQLMSQHPRTGKSDPTIFAQNLAESIRLGKRSDLMHHELIIKGCAEYGGEFARPFMIRLRPVEGTPDRAIDHFIIKGPRLERIVKTCDTEPARQAKK